MGLKLAVSGRYRFTDSLIDIDATRGTITWLETSEAFKGKTFKLDRDRMIDDRWKLDEATNVETILNRYE
jgi:hypothetical protein